MTTSLPSLRRKILRSFWMIALLYGVLGLFLVISVQIASRTSPKMIHVNYDSIAAADQMREGLAAIKNPESYPGMNREQARSQVERALAFEEGNVTDPGEKEIALSLRASWDRLKNEAEPPSPEDFSRVNQALRQLVVVNERGMFKLAHDNERLSQDVVIGTMIFFLISLIASLFLGDGLARRISTPLKNVAEALHQRPTIGRKLKLAEPNTLELLILTNELTHLWERVTESEKVNVREIVQQKSKLESVLESVEDALLVVDANGTVSHANECMLQLLRLAEGDVKNRKWNDLPTVHENYSQLRALLNSEMADSTEVELLLKNATRQYSARFRKIVSPSGGLLGTLFLLHDITEKRQRDRFRADFIDMLSHEIKTPLQSLGTATELLTAKKHDLPEALQPLVDTVAEDVERIKAVANEFVQVTQSHSRIMRLKMEMTPLNQVVQEWLKPFQVVAKDRGLKLVYEKEGSDIIWANLDRIKFPWVISNLLSNALRFAPPGSPVTVHLSDRNGAIEIQVKDEGPGISDADQRRMFEPFFQSSMMTPTGTKGLFGIGLTIAKEVVEAHDGRIEYYPRAPHGSEIKIVLPFPPA